MLLLMVISHSELTDMHVSEIYVFHFICTHANYDVGNLVDENDIMFELIMNVSL